MAGSIKNRVFGSDIPLEIKKKLEARQRLAEKDISPNESITDSQYSTDPFQISDTGNFNTNGIADLSSRTPFVRMWVGLEVSKATYIGIASKDDWFDENGGWTLKQTQVSNGQMTGVEESYETFEELIGQEKYFFKPGKGDQGSFVDIWEWKKYSDSERIYELGNHVLTTEETSDSGDINKVQQSKSTGATSADGDLSSAAMSSVLPHEQESNLNRFLKPPAGIKSMTSETEGALGSIKKTTVNFVVHNFDDFENIYLKYFMKPGKLVFVDYGWDTADLYNTKDLIDDRDNLNENLYGDNGWVTKSKGEMDTLYGHVVNYDAKLRPDGGFDCMIEIMSKNYALVNTQVADEFRTKVSRGLDIEIMGVIASGLFGDKTLYDKARQWTNSTTTEEELRQAFGNSLADAFGAATVDSPGLMLGDKKIDRVTELAHKMGLFILQKYSSDEEAKEFSPYVSWGWFEDNFMNTQFGYSDNSSNIRNAFVESHIIDDKKTMAKWDSTQSYLTYDKDLYFLQNTAHGRGGSELSTIMLYPAQWGGETFTYNTVRNMRPNILKSELREFVQNGEQAKADNRSENNGYFSSATTEFEPVNVKLADGSNISISYLNTSGNDAGENIQRIYAQLEQRDRKNQRIPLRECYFSTQFLKECLQAGDGVSDFLRAMSKRLYKLSQGCIDLAVASNSYGQHTLALVDKNQLMNDETIQSKSNM